MAQKTLLLTGASRGIGHATVKHFHSADWRVLTVSRQSFHPDECPWALGQENHIQMDLSDLDALDEGIRLIRERLGGQPLHALVNNAAISPKGPAGERLDTLGTELSTWRQVFDVNFFAPVLLARGLIEALRAAPGASIVNVTSIAGGRVHPFAGAAYATSKAALAALTREMAADLGPHGVRVNGIAPGEIETAILSPGTEKLAERIPLRRLGKPEEVASVIYFLCTHPAAYVSGAEIHINGGQHV
jgi:NAD(P)-dependent dehydrogenase (short-subunit alcohol dehydrogenase family)